MNKTFIIVIVLALLYLTNAKNRICKNIENYENTSQANPEQIEKVETVKDAEKPVSSILGFDIDNCKPECCYDQHKEGNGISNFRCARGAGCVCLDNGNQQNIQSRGSNMDLSNIYI